MALLALLGLIPFHEFLFSDQILFASDQIGSPAWKFYLDALGRFEIPLWNPFGLGGMPTFDAMFGDASYPVFILLGLLLPVESVISYNFVLHVLIAGFTAFILLRRYFGLDYLLAAPLALAYMLNTNFISHIHAGHTGKFYIMAWLPLGLFFLLRSLDASARWFHMLGLALTVALFISTSHLQFTYYVLMGYFLVWAFKSYTLVREKEYGQLSLTAGKFWLPVLLGVGLCFFIFYPPTQYNAGFSVRGEGDRQSLEHATSWSMHPEETFSLIVPEFGGINENYWGRNPFKLNSEYTGMSVLFLGVFSLVLFRRSWMWLWFGIGTLALIFALGANTPFFQIFYHLIPGIKSFRAPSMILFWLATALLVVSAMGLKLCVTEIPKASSEVRNRWSKKLLQWGLAIAGALLLFGIAAPTAYGLYNGFVHTEAIANFARQNQNATLFATGAIRAALLLAALVFITWKWLLKKQDTLRFGFALIALTAVDLIWVNSNFIKTCDVGRTLPREAAVEFLLQEKEPFRVFGVPGAYERSFMQYHRIETVDGFTDNEYNLYRNYRGGDYQRNPNFMQGLMQNSDGSVAGSVFLDMLNVKYLGYRIPNDPGLKLAENKTALPRAYFVGDWETAGDEVILQRMLQPGFDPRARIFISETTPPSIVRQITAPPTTSRHDALSDTSALDTTEAAALAQAPKAAPAPAQSSAEISATDRSYNRLSYSVQNREPGILVLSELYFPHWQARVNDRPVEILRVNYAFRGVALEPGTHTVVMEYRSPWIRKGLWVSLGSLLCLVVGLTAYRFLIISRNDPLEKKHPGRSTPA